MKRERTKDWLETSRAKRLVQITNIKDKIPGYAATLPYPAEKVERLILTCETHIALANYVNQIRASVAQLNEYEVLMNTAKGGKQNAPAPQLIEFQTLALPDGAFVGLIPALRELVDDIKHADNYTRGIGEDLMIVPPESERISERDVSADIKVSAVTRTYKVRIEGKLRGMDAIRLDWLKKGTDIWRVGVGFLTKLPGEIEISPTTPGEPESGSLRGILIDENEPVGAFSPYHPITIG